MSAAAVREIIASAPVYECDLSDISDQSRLKPPPGPLAKDAYRGLAGDIVHLIEPHTEADPIAILAELLVIFGTVVGRGPYFVAEADRHFTNEYMVLVGTTSKARKGSSWGQAKRPFERLEAFSSLRIGSGLASGEGLVHAVRDERRGRARDGEEVVLDEGVVDKRLLVYEAEFASPLRVASRDGNVLSVEVREAWDTGDLETLTKNNHTRATGAHISIIGHVTSDELLRELSRTDAANGFGNRFLWLYVHRSKLLPEGGHLDDGALEDVTRRLADAVACARTTGEMRRDNLAKAAWRTVYPALSEGRPGLLGAITARAEAHVMRLACLYALLDSSPVIREDHLKAGLALWEYAEASCEYIFGDCLGDPAADEILRALRSNLAGLTRTNIRDLFGRHRPAGEINRALGALLSAGLAGMTEEETGGRPVERWYPR